MITWGGGSSVKTRWETDPTAACITYLMELLVGLNKSVLLHSRRNNNLRILITLKEGK